MYNSLSRKCNNLFFRCWLTFQNTSVCETLVQFHVESISELPNCYCKYSVFTIVKTARHAKHSANLMFRSLFTNHAAHPIVCALRNCEMFPCLRSKYLCSSVNVFDADWWCAIFWYRIEFLPSRILIRQYCAL